VAGRSGSVFQCACNVFTIIKTPSHPENIFPLWRQTIIEVTDQRFPTILDIDRITVLDGYRSGRFYRTSLCKLDRAAIKMAITSPVGFELTCGGY
jgi:hypothetical protein